ncbi:probable LRR receptor-like serine/threonine-protein kinase At2g16250 [Nicotiana tomentosiformis]|uniref:probable LRR receptor-like serine/threonine-protein kinase At2g16250 n=1 Tax=Nicotiana tomentosiformis TaxID=4098 RepID=UPI00144511A2|nr:probable LRR receptor-like serine/threonine-protein kinase At2g16250 [Nicotiana tomentosiformis]
MHQLSKRLYLFFVFFLLFDSTFELNLREERLALRQLRSSLGLRDKEWPIRANSCTNWKGIRCKNGHVTEINISGFQRTTVGQQNPQFSVEALQNLTFLETFNASNFALPGPIPQWFGFKLASTLQILDLRFCSITGHIPSNLGYLSNLTILYLSNNNLTGIVPSGLGQLSSLAVLDLSRNSLVGSIPVSFGSLRNLIMLDMSSNYMSGPIPPSIGTLSKLRFLNLLNNSFSYSIAVQVGYLNKVD